MIQLINPFCIRIAQNLIDVFNEAGEILHECFDLELGDLKLDEDSTAELKDIEHDLRLIRIDSDKALNAVCIPIGR